MFFFSFLNEYCEHICVFNLVIELDWGFCKFESVADRLALEELQVEYSSEIYGCLILYEFLPFDTDCMVDSEALEHFSNELRRASGKIDQIDLPTFLRD